MSDTPTARAAKNLRSTVRKFGRCLCHDFDKEIERDPSRFKQRVLALLQAELPPSPGRPRSKHITLAAAMHEKGESWRKVYSACVPKVLNGDSRQVAQTRLRAAVRARVRRCRRRTSRRKEVDCRSKSRDGSESYRTARMRRKKRTKSTCFCTTDKSHAVCSSCERAIPLLRSDHAQVHDSPRRVRNQGKWCTVLRECTARSGACGSHQRRIA
jgi:hypothetical protein